MIDSQYSHTIFSYKVHFADIHISGMNRGGAVVRMKNDTKLPGFVFEHSAVSYANKIAGFLQQRIIGIFGPIAHNAGRGSTSHAVKLTFVAVGRVGHIV